MWQTEVYWNTASLRIVSKEIDFEISFTEAVIHQ